MFKYPCNFPKMNKTSPSYSVRSVLLENDSREELCIYSQRFFKLILEFCGKKRFINFFLLHLHSFLLENIDFWNKKKFESGPKTTELHRKLELQNQWCLNQLLFLLAVWRGMVQSSQKSVQIFLFSSVDFELDPVQSWIRGVRSSRLNSRWGKGEMVPYRLCGVHHRARAQSMSVKESPWRAQKKIGFYIFNQGSYFEYIWLNRIFHFTVLIINHTHWINVVFVIPLKCNFFCTVNELHNRSSILYSW